MLTEQMRNTLVVIEAHMRRHGKAPTYTELMHLTGHSSRSSIFATLRRLAERGYVAISPYRVRGVTLLKPSMGESGTIAYFEWDDKSQTLVRFTPKINAPERATALEHGVGDQSGMIDAIKTSKPICDAQACAKK